MEQSLEEIMLPAFPLTCFGNSSWPLLKWGGRVGCARHSFVMSRPVTYVATNAWERRSRWNFSDLTWGRWSDEIGSPLWCGECLPFLSFSWHYVRNWICWPNLSVSRFERECSLMNGANSLGHKFKNWSCNRNSFNASNVSEIPDNWIHESRKCSNLLTYCGIFIHVLLCMLKLPTIITNRQLVLLKESLFQDIIIICQSEG